MGAKSRDRIFGDKLRAAKVARISQDRLSFAKIPVSLNAFETLFKQTFAPAQPDLFLADEIERLRLAPPDEDAAN